MKSLSFFKGLSWLIVLNLLVKPVWIFFIDRQVQNLVGHEAYGTYFSLLNLSFVFFFITDAGLSNMLNQRMANGMQVNIAKLLRVKIFLLFFYSVSVCFIGWLTHIARWDLLIYIIIIQVLTSLFIFLRSMITANQYFTTDAWFSVIDKLLMIILCGAIIYSSSFQKITLPVFLKVQTLCTAIAVLLAVFFIAKKNLLTHTGREETEKLIKLVLPFTICILLMSVHYRLDGFLLERIHLNGAFEAGIYASAYRLLDAGNMAGYLAASFLLPFIARHQSDKKLLQDVIIHTRHGLIFFATGVVCFIIVFAPWLQQLLYHTSDPYNSLVIQLCIASLPGYYLVHIYGSMLTATMRFKPFIIILIISVLLNLILNLILIPAKGAQGCCIAALASQYFCGIASFIVATRKFEISFAPISILVYVLLAVMLLSLFYFGRMAISNVWIILAIASVLSLLLLATQIAFVKKYFISIRQ